MRKLIVILDPAHGSDVKGKRSPDGTHLEYIWSREICKKLKDRLILNDFRVKYTNETENEIGLSKRKEIANNIKSSPGEYKFLVSLHNNATGDGTQWLNAKGFEIYTSKGQTISDKFATIIFNNLKKDFPGINARADYIDGDPDKESNFTVLMGNYYAVLIEWLFQDNKEEVILLKDKTINSRLVDSLVNSLIEIDEQL